MQWGYPKLAKREHIPRGFQPKPRFEVKHLCSFQMSTKDKYERPRLIIGLNVLAAIQDTTTNQNANLTILAVLATETDGLGSPKTSVIRYELSYEDEEIHPAFTQISQSTNISTTLVSCSYLTNVHHKLTEICSLCLSPCGRMIYK